MMNREIRLLIPQGQGDMAIEDAAVSSGMQTLAMSGREKF